MKPRLLFAVGLTVLVLIYLGLSHYMGRSAAARVPVSKTTTTPASAALTVDEVIAAWKAGEATPLKPVGLENDSAALRDVIKLLANAGLTTVSTVFPPKADVRLTAKQAADLELAILGLVVAYRDNEPADVLAYMRERGEKLERSRRERMEAGISKSRQRDLSALSDDEFYVKAWTLFHCDPHWHGLVASESRWQTWDGRGTSTEEIRRIELDPLNNPLSDAAILSQLFRGDVTSQHNFAPMEGSLDEELGGDEAVVLADVKLIVQLDQTLANERVAYIVRFWFNRAAGKWQPIALAGIPWSPNGNMMPNFLF